MFDIYYIYKFYNNVLSRHHFLHFIGEKSETGDNKQFVQDRTASKCSMLVFKPRIPRHIFNK